MKLGKKPVKNDSRNLQFKKYVKRVSLPPLHSRKRWGQKIRAWGMMKNDTIGDCTIATVGHMVMQWTSDALNSTKVISDNDIVRAYTAVTALENHGHGYDPLTGENDNGCAILDVLNYWHKNGVGRDRCGAFVQLEAGNVQHVQESIFLFGNAYLGLNLPLTAQEQIDKNLGWSVPKTGPKGDGAPGSWGGHAVPVVGYDKDGLTCVTWGRLQHLSYNFLKVYSDEGYAVLSQDWFKNGVAPSGFDLATLQKDLNLLGSKPEVQHHDLWHQFLDWFHSL
jgi:hypothetical protein